MGFRNVSSGVEKLVAWIDANLKDPSVDPGFYRVFLERSSKECLLFGKSPCVRARIEDTKSGKVYAKANFSLYPFVPPIIKPYADARTLDILEKVSLVLHDKRIRYDSSL